jgi:hypothetical protein
MILGNSTTPISQATLLRDRLLGYGTGAGAGINTAGPFTAKFWDDATLWTDSTTWTD